jgi:hypothetical protein
MPAKNRLFSLSYQMFYLLSDFRIVGAKHLRTARVTVFGGSFWKHRAESNCRLSFSRGKRSLQRLAD